MRGELPAVGGRQREGRCPHHGCGLPAEGALRGSAPCRGTNTCCSTATITRLPALAAVTPPLSLPLQAVRKFNTTINRSIYLHCSQFYYFHVCNVFLLSSSGNGIKPPWVCNICVLLILFLYGGKSRIVFIQPTRAHSDFAPGGNTSALLIQRFCRRLFSTSSQTQEVFEFYFTDCAGAQNRLQKGSRVDGKSHGC